MKQKKLLLMTLIAVGVMGVSWAVISWLSPAKKTLKTVVKSVKQTPEEQLSYLESEQFVNLDEKEKLKYVKSLDHVKLFKKYLKLPKEDKKKLRQHVGGVFRAMMMERITAYSDLKTPEEKRAYLDRMIDKMEAFRDARRESGVSDEQLRKRREERRKKGPSLSRIKKRIETTDPKKRAGFMGFMMDMRTRMQERGIKSFRR